MMIMELKVKTLDSQTHSFNDLDDEMTVISFKEHISESVGLPPEQQRLIFRGRVLQDDKKLKDYNVASGQVIHLVVRNSSSSTANDQPPPAVPNAGGNFEMGGANGAIIMGTIESVEITPVNSGVPPNAELRSSAAIRLSAARQVLQRASALLRTLEEQNYLLNSLSTSTPTSDTNLGEGSSSGPTNTPESTTSQNAPTNLQSSTTTPSTTTSSSGQQNSTAGTGTSSTTTRRSPEAPLPSELGSVLNDLHDVNSRLSPYLLIVQRWLADNVETRNQASSFQYAYETVTSILHSVSHATHLLSDIRVDWTLEPPHRRLRSTQQAVLMSPLLRGLPFVHLEMESPQLGGGGGGGMRRRQGTNVMNQQQQSGGQSVPQFPAPSAQRAQFHGLTNPLAGSISTMVHGMLSGNSPNNTSSTNAQNTGNNVNVSLNSQGGAESGGGMNMQMPMPPFLRSVILDSLSSGGAHFTVPPQGQPARGASTTAPRPPRSVPPPRAGSRTRHTGATNPLLQSYFDSASSRPTPDMSPEALLLQCQSHHSRSSAPSRLLPPPNLVDFLQGEMRTGLGVSAEGGVDDRRRDRGRSLDVLLSVLGGSVVLEGLVGHYLRSEVLRGRDGRNLGHVQTGVKPIARRVVDWIMSSIDWTQIQDGTIREEFKMKLTDLSTQILAKLAQAVVIPDNNLPLVRVVQTIFARALPDYLRVFETLFPPPAHITIIRNMIDFVLGSLFPHASLVLRDELRDGLSEYFLKCRTRIPQEEVEDDLPVGMGRPMILREAVGSDGMGIGVGGGGEIVGVVEMEINVEMSGNELLDDEMMSELFSPSSTSTPTHGRTSSTPRPPTPTPTRGNLNVNEEEEEEEELYDIEEGGATQHAVIDSSMDDSLIHSLPSEWRSTLMHDIVRQYPLMSESRPEYSSGFRTLFSRK